MKQPEKTREWLVEAAFAEIRRVGYQAASVDRILEGVPVTKGALYHHFASKLELGYAVVEGPVARWLREHWLNPIERAGDALVGMEAALEDRIENASPEELRLGSPLGMLILEMSSIDEGFRVRLEALVAEWRDTIARALRAAQSDGAVRRGADPDAAAAFLVTVCEGICTVAASTSDRAAIRPALEAALDFLDTLRP